MATLVASSPVTAASWRSVARVMGQTGGASLASGLLSLIATKIIAMTFGPAQVALLATLQQIRTTATTCGSLTGQTALIQGASSSCEQQRREYLRTVAGLMAFATGITIVILTMFPHWIAMQTGLAAPHQGLAKALSATIVLAVLYVFLSSLLNAAGAVGPLALVGLAGPASMAVVVYWMARTASHPEMFFVVALTVSSGVATIAAAWGLWNRRQALRDWFYGHGAWWNWLAVRKFFTISGLMFASGLLSSWAITIVRARVLRSEGLATAGELDAAWTISMNQAGLILASLQTFYLPTLARISEPQQRFAHIARVLTIATISAAVLISLLISFKPLLLTTLYSEAFAGSTRYLRWTLAGDYLKITSWILSIPLIASARMRSFLAADVAAYSAFVMAAFGLSNWMGAAESMSIAFIAMYTTHLLFCGACLWLRREFRPTSPTVFLWLAGLGMIVVFSAVFWTQT